MTLMLFGAALYAYIVGGICGIFANMNEEVRGDAGSGYAPTRTYRLQHSGSREWKRSVGHVLRPCPLAGPHPTQSAQLAKTTPTAHPEGRSFSLLVNGAAAPLSLLLNGTPQVSDHHRAMDHLNKYMQAGGSL